MNKAQLIDEVAKVTCSKKEAELAVGAAFAAIQKALKKGDAVTLVGFGTFRREQEKSRKGRNPRRAKPSRSPQRRFRLFKRGRPERRSKIDRRLTIIDRFTEPSRSPAGRLFFNQ